MQLFAKPLDEDARFWWETIGPILATMMQQANYRTHLQYHNLHFFHRYVAPALGPRPGRNGDAAWRSFMTDDHTPIELSWSWATSRENPAVRYAVEPIDKGSSSSSSSSERAGAACCSHIPAIRRLVDAIRPVCPLLDLTWFDSLAQSLTVPCGTAKSDARSAARASPASTTAEPRSQYFAAFDLALKGIVFKAYFLPRQRALRDAKSPWDLVHAAVRPIAAPHAAMAGALGTLAKYLKTCAASYAMQVEIVAVDCVPAALSRLKIYFRSRATSFKSVRHVMTLGGVLRQPGMEEALRKLRLLWELVLGPAPGWSDEDELDVLRHRTAGMLYYFEFRPAADLPIPKLYIPVRHYAHNDLQIAAGLATYFGDAAEEGYLSMLRETL
jgi:DMATS type aromatic prenyltransferase